MASTTAPAGSDDRSTAHRAPLVAAHDWRDPRYQAYMLLRIAFTVAPIAFGLDKFFNVLVDWPNYLAPWINDIAARQRPGLHVRRRRRRDRRRLIVAHQAALRRATSSRPGSAGIIINLLTSRATTTSPCATSG